jgi:hypothetical protein
MKDLNHGAVSRLFDRIAPMFKNNDLAGFRACYQVPCMVITPDQVFSIATEDAFDSFFGKMLAELRTLDYSESLYDDLRVKTLSPTVALAVMRWRRLKGDGSVLNAIGTTYTVVKHDGDWRVLTVAIHDTDSMATFA